MSEEEQQRDSDVAMVKKVADQLGEHFDSVQIFATRHESGSLDGTISVHVGVGNWFARYGQISEWMVKSDEWTRMKARKDDDL